MTKYYRVWADVSNDTPEEETEEEEEVTMSPVVRDRRMSRPFEAPMSPAMQFLKDSTKSADFTDVIMGGFSPFIAPSPGFGPLGVWPPTNPMFSPTFSPRIAPDINGANDFCLTAEGDEDGIMMSDDEHHARNPGLNRGGSSILDTMMQNSAYRAASG